MARRGKRHTVFLLSVASTTVALPACGGATEDSSNTSRLGSGASSGAGGGPNGTGLSHADAGGIVVPSTGGTTAVGLTPNPGAGGTMGQCAGHVCGVVVVLKDAETQPGHDSGFQIQPADAGGGGAIADGSVPVPGLAPRP